MERRALVVGIDNYLNVSSLGACVADALAVEKLLATHADGDPNYDCQTLLASTDPDTTVSRAELRAALQRLFEGYRGDVLFYFSGHGALIPTGGCLATSDAVQNDLGIPMQEVMELAYRSEARDILVLLDCCHSGDMGNPPSFNYQGQRDPLSLVRENMTVIAASRPFQPALEAGDHGLFTAALIDALDGGAADHMGWVTPGPIYAYVERRFGEWEPRPVYKTHATRTTVVRECAPLIERIKLRELVVHFPSEDYKYPLDPEHEPDDEHGNVHEPVNHAKVAVAQLFKEFRDAGLLKPSTPGEQLFWTARRGNTVELTPRGREYWRLVKYKRI